MLCFKTNKTIVNKKNSGFDNIQKMPCLNCLVFWDEDAKFTCRNFALCMFLTPLVPCLFKCYDTESKSTVVFTRTEHKPSAFVMRPVYLEDYGDVTTTTTIKL